MKINNVTIKGFGKFHGASINFDDGINVIYGKNEAGKSTAHTFIKAMLFGMNLSKKDDIYNKYIPWYDEDIYEGTLDFTYQDKKYQIFRTFSANKPSLSIKNLDEDILVNDPTLFLNEVLYNLNFTSFDNSISIGQLKSAQEKSLIKELHRYIANLNTSGDMHIDTMKAINYLKRKKDNYTLSVKTDATLLYNKQLASIKVLEKELDNISTENQIQELKDKKDTLAREKNTNTLSIEKDRYLITTNETCLKKYGFVSKNNINALSKETEKHYTNYTRFLDTTPSVFGIILNIIFMFFGILMITSAVILFFIYYKNALPNLNISDFSEKFAIIKNLIDNITISPQILISSLFSIGFILFLYNIYSMCVKASAGTKLNEATNILSDIFKKHLGSEYISDSNMTIFRKHIKDMLDLIKQNESTDLEINRLVKRNKEIDELQIKLDDTITNQKRIQYDVEKKYNELNKIRNENLITKEDIANNDNITKEIESIDLAIETMISLSDQIRTMFGTHLNEAASYYMQYLTNGKYNSLNIDNNLNISINYEDRSIPLSQVSTGTIDQIYLAVRLAIADLISKDKEPLPLIFDDCFAMYDNERIENALKFLSEQIKTQILIFSCHTRERALLLHNQIPFNSIEI